MLAQPTKIVEGIISFAALASTIYDKIAIHRLNDKVRNVVGGTTQAPPAGPTTQTTAGQQAGQGFKDFSMGGFSTRKDESMYSDLLRALGDEQRYALNDFLVWLLANHPFKWGCFAYHFATEWLNDKANAIAKVAEVADNAIALKRQFPTASNDEIYIPVMNFCDQHEYTTDRTFTVWFSALKKGYGKVFNDENQQKLEKALLWLESKNTVIIAAGNKWASEQECKIDKKNRRPWWQKLLWY